MQLSSSPGTDIDSRPRLDREAVTEQAAARGGSPLHSARQLIESDPGSFASDYSELGEPIREHLAGVQIIGRDDLDLANTVLDLRAAADQCEIQYERCYFNVRSKADMSQLNLPHGKMHRRIGRYRRPKH